MARLLSDENVPLPVSEHLRGLGHDVVTLSDLGLANQSVPDDDVLALGTAAGRAIVTHNRKDFIRLHRASADHAGVVVCTFDADFERQAGRISDALKLVSELRGQLIRVNRPDR